MLNLAVCKVTTGFYGVVLVVYILRVCIGPLRENSHIICSLNYTKKKNHKALNDKLL